MGPGEEKIRRNRKVLNRERNGESWTAAVDLRPTIPKSGSSLGGLNPHSDRQPLLLLLLVENCCVTYLFSALYLDMVTSNALY
jgi:hypothetical protein